MSLTGKQVFQIEIKSSGDVFHELFKNKPHEMSSISPDIVHGCELHHGDWGTVGSIIFWTYTHGKFLILSIVLLITILILFFFAL